MPPAGQTLSRTPSADAGEQIKTRQRVRDLAEVYTHSREVNAMLDLIPDMFPGTLDDVEYKFLEPACGSGNFLVEILRRKLVPIGFAATRDRESYEHWLLRALASIYAVDICEQNVDDARARLLETLHWHYFNDQGAGEPTPALTSAAFAILETNIVRADMLDDARSTEVIDYRAAPGGVFIRAWSLLEETGVDDSPSLFDAPAEPKQDGEPIHYRDLASQPAPTAAVSTPAALRP